MSEHHPALAGVESASRGGSCEAEEAAVSVALSPTEGLGPDSVLLVPSFLKQSYRRKSALSLGTQGQGFSLQQRSSVHVSSGFAQHVSLVHPLTSGVYRHRRADASGDIDTSLSGTNHGSSSHAVGRSNNLLALASPSPLALADAASGLWGHSILWNSSNQDGNASARSTLRSPAVSLKDLGRHLRTSSITAARTTRATQATGTTTACCSHSRGTYRPTRIPVHPGGPAGHGEQGGLADVGMITCAEEEASGETDATSTAMADVDSADGSTGRTDGGGKASGDGKKGGSKPDPAAGAFGRKASVFKPFALHTMHQRCFALAWVGLHLAFASTFAPAALLPVISKELNLSKAVVGGAGVAALASSVITRVLAAAWVRRVGPRYCQVITLLATAPALACMALVRNGAGFVLLRFLLGCPLALFVVAQFWVVAMFDSSVLGAAAATCASWGNAGGGLPMLVMPLIYTGLKSAYGDDSGPAWRAAFYFPASAAVVLTVVTLAFGQDTAAGDLMDRFNARRAYDIRTFGYSVALPYWEGSTHHKRAAPQALNGKDADSSNSRGGRRGTTDGGSIRCGDSSVRCGGGGRVETPAFLSAAEPAAPAGANGGGDFGRMSVLEFEGDDRTTALSAAPSGVADSRLSEGGDSDSLEGRREYPWREAIELYLFALRNPRTLLLATAYGATFGAQLVAFNTLPIYLSQQFGLGPVAVGGIASVFGLLNLGTRVSGGLLSSALSRRWGWGMRGRLWLLWGSQAAGGLFCALMGGAAHHSLPATVVFMVLFAVGCQQAAGATFAIAPYVSFRSYPAVLGIVSAGGHLVAVLLQAALFSHSWLSYADGWLWMGVSMMGLSLPLLLLHFPAWGGMLRGPAVETARDSSRHQTWTTPVFEEDYYLQEWTAAERAAGMANGALAFSRLARAERGRGRVSGARRATGVKGALAAAKARAMMGV